MTGWTSDELATIGTVQELGLAAARRHVGQAGDYLARPRGRRPLVRSMYGRTGGCSPPPRCSTKATSGPAASTRMSPSNR